ncbi:nuclear transport factor 2 family protein [Sphingomonas sp. 28-62-11]|uniref:nuclear transport factor 2 family protein n=1 Tax=Sphingomonas sp. 28-62-11 TaxID=1970432 RepID=UPI000BD61B90|nr:MAG: hypothetical protein B7Y49_02320 [Sphingomonas sp. 28-62-11]
MVRLNQKLVVVSAALIGMGSVTTAGMAQTPAAAPTSPAVNAADVAAIEAVIERFKTAIKTKDKPGMAALFYDNKVVWRTSGHPASRDALARMQGKPTAVVEDEGAYQFLDDPRLAKIDIEERFYHPQIITDGQIATVVFNYDFRLRGAIQNWGQESWQMVKTPSGWRILHLLFSANLQMIAAAPAER